MTLASSVLGSSQLRDDWPSVGLPQILSSRHSYMSDKTVLCKMDGVKNSLVAMLCIINKESVHSRLKATWNLPKENISETAPRALFKSNMIKLSTSPEHLRTPEGLFSAHLISSCLMEYLIIINAMIYNLRAPWFSNLGEVKLFQERVILKIFLDLN